VRNLEAVIARDAIGCILLVFGVGWLIVHQWPGASDVAASLASASGYLEGVIGRALNQPYEGLMIAAFVAVPLHAALTFGLRRVAGVVEAYDQFGTWAQSIFTAFGFLGTIIGVSLAVAGLETAMEQDDPAALISGLSTAFDTTFWGLTSAIFLMVIRKISRMLAKKPQPAE
jgi:hypothetical protein